MFWKKITLSEYVKVRNRCEACEDEIRNLHAAVENMSYHAAVFNKNLDLRISALERESPMLPRLPDEVKSKVTEPTGRKKPKK